MTNLSPTDVILEALAHVAPEADLSSVGADADLRLELDLDSMDFLNFVIGLHQAFGVEVPETDYRKLLTLDDCVTYLAVRVKPA